MTLTVGSVCSGIGGLELGLLAAGLGPVLWQIEIDPFCRAVLARHWPDVDRSVTDVRDEAAIRGLRRVELVCAGFPCQPASSAGKRRGRADERWLWPSIDRLLRVVRPRFVFLENVAALLTVDGGAAFGDVLGSLASLGYAAEWTLLRASDVGAPHRRERLFVLADLADTDGDGLLRLGEDDVRPVPRLGEQRGHDADGRGALGRGRTPDQPAGAAPLGLGGPQSVVGRGADGLPGRVDRWPARPGEAQADWEPPRVGKASDPTRPQRLRTLGNAVVEQQACAAWQLLWRRAQARRAA